MQQKAQNRGANMKDIQALCTYCGKEIRTPELKVMVGKRLLNHPGSYFEENTMFISAEELHKWIEMMFLDSEDMKLEMHKIRQFNKHIFWNLIYYFNDYHLPFEFLLNYEDTRNFDEQYEELKRMAARVKV